MRLSPASRFHREPEYAALLRSARAMFEPAELVRLIPRLRKGPSLAEVNGAGSSALEPIAATETIAHDFLALGGKYARPFITLAAYQAMTNGAKSSPTITNGQPHIPDAVRRVALSIEIFHKASLVHDDIEDADEFRYGRPTLHQVPWPAHRHQCRATTSLVWDTVSSVASRLPSGPMSWATLSIS